MLQEIIEDHIVDEDGKPAGGCTSGTGFAISWQRGPLGRGKKRRQPNGAFVEGIIQAALGRLEFYQDTEFACTHNAVAIRHLKDALRALQLRTAEREGRKVEGTHKV